MKRRTDRGGKKGYMISHARNRLCRRSEEMKRLQAERLSERQEPADDMLNGQKYVLESSGRDMMK